MLELLLDTILNNLLVSLIVVVVCLLLTNEYMKISGQPPGPYGLPWFGYAFFLQRNTMSKQLAGLCRQYKTDILSLTAFGMQFVVVGTHELAKEVFQKRTDASDRLPFNIFQKIDPRYSGIVLSTGKTWKEVRRFSLSTLRNFGMGRVGAEEMIQNEARILCQEMKKLGEEPCNPETPINIAVSNIICGMVMGQRFEHDDSEFVSALHSINLLMSRLNSPLAFVTLGTNFGKYILRHRFRKIMEDYSIFNNFVLKQIEEHKKDYSGQTTDLIYCYLKEVEEDRNADIFDQKMLECLIMDFFTAGSETTYSTLRWALLAMAGNPDVQKKVQEELDRVLGDRTPSMNDKKDTPYSEAVLSEVQRHYTLAPLSVPHSNLDGEIYINDYKVRKTSVLFTNIDGIHHDDRLWKNPDNFDPENFLEDGKVCNLEKLVPFGIGRRACAGESLARMELYLFFVSLVRAFDIKPETDETIPDMEGVLGIVYQPKPFKVRLKARF